jgi:hypothetical protein
MGNELLIEYRIPLCQKTLSKVSLATTYLWGEGHTQRLWGGGSPEMLGDVRVVRVTFGF